MNKEEEWNREIVECSVAEWKFSGPSINLCTVFSQGKDFGMRMLTKGKKQLNKVQPRSFFLFLVVTFTVWRQGSVDILVIDKPLNGNIEVINAHLAFVEWEGVWRIAWDCKSFQVCVTNLLYHGMYIYLHLYKNNNILYFFMDLLTKK